MTTILDIPAYIRRCPEEHEKKNMEHNLRDHAIGYADLATKLTSVLASCFMQTQPKPTTYSSKQGSSYAKRRSR